MDNLFKKTDLKFIKNLTFYKNQENRNDLEVSNKPKAKRQLQMLKQSSTHEASSDTLKKTPSILLSSSDSVLSSEQVSILDGFKSGRNIFITGSAGTGKSFILNKIISELCFAFLLVCFYFLPTFIFIHGNIQCSLQINSIVSAIFPIKFL